MPALNILLIEDSADDAELLAIELAEAGIDTTWVRVDRESTLRNALAAGGYDLVVSDLSLPGFAGVEALRLVRAALPGVPFVFCSGAPVGSLAAEAALGAGADGYVCKDELARMPQAVRESLQPAAPPCPA